MNQNNQMPPFQITYQLNGAFLRTQTFNNRSVAPIPNVGDSIQLQFEVNNYEAKSFETKKNEKGEDIPLSFFGKVRHGLLETLKVVASGRGTINRTYLVENIIHNNPGMSTVNLKELA